MKQEEVLNFLQNIIFNMRYKLSLVLLIIVSVAFAQKADDIIGKYHLPNKLDVKIFKYKNKYYGKIIALNCFENGETTDSNTNDKTKPLIGMIIIRGLEFSEKEKQWINGKMYGPEKGIFFDLKVTEIHPQDIKVVGSKYFFWKTLVWKKI